MHEPSVICERYGHEVEHYPQILTMFVSRGLHNMCQLFEGINLLDNYLDYNLSGNQWDDFQYYLN